MFKIRIHIDARVLRWSFLSGSRTDEKCGRAVHIKICTVQEFITKAGMRRRSERQVMLSIDTNRNGRE